MNNSETKDFFVNVDKIQGSNCNWSRGKIENSHFYSWKRRRFGITVRLLIPGTDSAGKCAKTVTFMDHVYYQVYLLPNITRCISKWKLVVTIAGLWVPIVQVVHDRYHGDKQSALSGLIKARERQDRGGTESTERKATKPRITQDRGRHRDTERRERPEKKKTKEKADRTEREGENPESRRKQEIKWKKGEDVAQPGRHQRLHLRSSSYRSVEFFFPRFSFLITLALLPACVSNSRTHARQ